jgi:hypothetical protein
VKETHPAELHHNRPFRNGNRFPRCVQSWRAMFQRDGDRKNRRASPATGSGDIPVAVAIARSA